MRISDLSRHTGVPVGTIKFYLRAGLLPPGTPTGRNQADYGEEHLRRLRFVRALTGIGHLDLSSVADLLAAIEDAGVGLPELYEAVNRAMFPIEPASNDIDVQPWARTAVDGFIDDRGWGVPARAPGRTRLARVLTAMDRLGCGCGVDFFTPFADAADRLAVHELNLVREGDTDRAAAVARTVLLEAALAALRRMAQEHHLTGLTDPEDAVD
jgi:DNA-binding transcriptional MerR regulator